MQENSGHTCFNNPVQQLYAFSIPIITIFVCILNSIFKTFFILYTFFHPTYTKILYTSGFHNIKNLQNKGVKVEPLLTIWNKTKTLRKLNSYFTLRLVVEWMRVIMSSRMRPLYVNDSHVSYKPRPLSFLILLYLNLITKHASTNCLYCKHSFACSPRQG